MKNINQLDSIKNEVLEEISDNYLKCKKTGYLNDFIFGKLDHIANIDALEAFGYIILEIKKHFIDKGNKKTFENLEF